MYSLPAAYSSPAMISSLVTYPLQFEMVGVAGEGGGRLGVIFAGAPRVLAVSACAQQRSIHSAGTKSSAISSKPP